PVDCGNNQCCPTGSTCNTLDPQRTLCCPGDFPVQCVDGCCPGGNTCNTEDPFQTTCCAPGYPVACRNACCPAGYQCSADGFSCVTPNPCTNTDYPLSCGNGFCCPSGDRCQAVLIGDVIQNYCCLDLPQE